MKSYQRKPILVASPCMMQSIAAVLVVHGGGANANQRWWSVGWKIAKEQHDTTKDFCILFVEFGVLMLMCISFYTDNRALLCTFVFLMLVSISFYTLLE